MELTATTGGAALRGASEYIVCIEGDRSWTVALPASGQLVVGRGAEAELRIDDAQVSRQHAQLLVVPEGLRLTDLGSRHGTLVNGEPLTAPRLVRAGDVIAIGGAVLVVQRPARPSGGGDVVETAGLVRRIDDELTRGVTYARETSLAVMRATQRFDRARAAAVLAGRLRRIDAAAFIGERHLAVLLPELGGDEASEIAAALASALAAESCAAGLATAPGDGIDADTLVASAREAADGAAPGAIARASDATRTQLIGAHTVVVADPAMIRLYELARRLARAPLPVLILGETGSGKELAAAAIHAASPRASGPFVSINCAAIPETLAESELFGHARGAFSGAVNARIGQLEAASGGTLFLDEVGELPAVVQAKLLRVLEDGRFTRLGETEPRTIDLRVVAATNRDLEAETGTSRFRQDLYFRLGAARLELPPLRDRPRDLAALTRIFAANACARLGRAPLALSIAAAQALFLHSWPGNVRELRNAIDYAVAAAPDDAGELEVWHLPSAIGRRLREPAMVPAAAAVDEPEASPAAAAASPAPAASPIAPSGFRPIADEIRALERARMIEALRVAGGMHNRAAELIEMPLRTFATKLKRYAIRASEYES